MVLRRSWKDFSLNEKQKKYTQYFYASQVCTDLVILPRVKQWLFVREYNIGIQNWEIEIESNTHHRVINDPQIVPTFKMKNKIIKSNKLINLSPISDDY